MAENEPPGFPFQYTTEPYGFEEHRRNIGRGINMLRADYLAQPRALRVGDILATGETIISEPREGGNGSVLLHLEDEWRGVRNGTWIGVPARIPIALSIPEDHPKT